MQWRGSKDASCPFWMPKQLHISIERVKIAAHLPVNTMTVWKSAGSGGIQCCVTLFLLSYLKFGGGKFCRSESPVSAKKSLRRNCFGKLGKTLIKSVSLSEKMKRAATMKKVEKTKKKGWREKESHSWGKFTGQKKKLMTTRISDITARRVSAQTPQYTCADTQANLIIGCI